MKVRLRLSLKLISKSNVMPLCHQKNLTAAVFNTFSNIEKDFMYSEDANLDNFQEKHIKLLNFSKILFPFGGWRVEGDRILLLCDTVQLVVNIDLKNATEEFLKGIILLQKLSVFDKTSQVDFMISHVNFTYEHAKTETLEMKTLSPMVITKKNQYGNDVFLSPKSEEYQKYLLINLMEKYYNLNKTLPNDWKHYPYEFEVTSTEIKQRGIYTDISHEEVVIGHEFSFKLRAPKELLEIGLTTGFGKQNWMGFGCVQLV
jgi:CRISPR-associated endoribonuclease Cas6